MIRLFVSSIDHVVKRYEQNECPVKVMIKSFNAQS